MWPNLGVNMPAGAAWSMSSNRLMASPHGRNYYTACLVCSASGNKPHPDQDKIDIAKEIGESCRLSPWTHAVMFDGSSLVDTWDANQLHPRKYQVRRP